MTNWERIELTVVAQLYEFLHTEVGRIILFMLILIATEVTARFIRNHFHQAFRNHSKLINIDHTQFTIMRHAMSLIVYIFGIGIAVLTIPQLKAIAISLFASAGVLAVVIGFASQKAFSNIISGIFIATFKPFRVDDLIKFDDKRGIVEDITLRHTVLRNFENKRYVVPNSVISDAVIENYNITDVVTCEFVEVGISYDSDIDLAMRIMRYATMQHPDFKDVRNEEELKTNTHPVTVKVVSFGDSSVNLRAWAWSDDPIKAFFMGCDLRKTIKELFDKYDVEIPFPYRTVVYKKDTERKSKKHLSGSS